MISAAAGGSSDIIVRTMFWLGVIPLVMALAARFVIVETRGQPASIVKKSPAALFRDPTHRPAAKSAVFAGAQRQRP